MLRNGTQSLSSGHATKNTVGRHPQRFASLWRQDALENINVTRNDNVETLRFWILGARNHFSSRAHACKNRRREESVFDEVIKVEARKDIGPTAKG